MNVFGSTFQSFETSLLDIKHVFRVYSPALFPTLWDCSNRRQARTLLLATAEQLCVASCWTAQPQIICPSKAEDFGPQTSCSQTAFLRSAPPSRHPPPAPTSKPEPDVGAEDTGLMEGARRMAEKSSSGRSEWDRSGEEVAERLELIADQWRKDESRRPRGERGADLG